MVCSQTNSIRYYEINPIPAGFGAFGEVLKGRGADGRDYAIKKIPKSKGQRSNISREIKAGNRLNHRSISKYTTHFEDEENDYVVFEFVKGLLNFRRFCYHERAEGRQLV